MKTILHLSCMLLISSLLISCQEDKPTYTLKKEDYIGFAKKLESSIKKGDSLFLDTAFNKKAFVKKINDGKEGDPKLLTTDINEAFTEGIMSRLKFGTEIVKNLEGGYYTFLKYYTNPEGVPHLVFRLFGKSGLNYHDFELSEVNGIVKISDCYILLSGEELSQSIRNAYLSL